MTLEEHLVIIGNRIKSLRKKKGWSQEDLSLEIESEQKHISKIENGKKDMRISTLRRIAAALEVHPEELIAR